MRTRVTNTGINRGCRLRADLLDIGQPAPRARSTQHAPIARRGHFLFQGYACRHGRGCSVHAWPTQLLEQRRRRHAMAITVSHRRRTRASVDRLSVAQSPAPLCFLVMPRAIPMRCRPIAAKPVQQSRGRFDCSQFPSSHIHRRLSHGSPRVEVVVAHHSVRRAWLGATRNTITYPPVASSIG